MLATPSSRLGVLDTSVRDVVGSSWKRSTQAGVSPTLVEPSYAAGLGAVPAGQHARGSRVMQRMAEGLAGEPVSMIFADPTGRVIHRICPDSSFGRQIERVSLAPGFTYAEDSVGTNGIGTALLTHPTLIVGSEHFTEPLLGFACAGAPVHHPIGGLVGVLDLRCRRVQRPAAHLRAVHRRAHRGRDPRQGVGARDDAAARLPRRVSARDRPGAGAERGHRHDEPPRPAAARRRRPHRPRGPHRRRRRGAAPHPRRGPAERAIARLDYRPTSVGSAVVGGVFQVQIQEPSSRPLRSTDSRPAAAQAAGVAGTSPEWTRAGAQARSHRAGTWVLLVGERGVGHALARSVHVAESPARHLRVLDAETASLDPDAWFQHLEDETVSEEGTLIIRHIDRLPAALVESVSSRLLEESDPLALRPGPLGRGDP